MVYICPMGIRNKIHKLAESKGVDIDFLCTQAGYKHIHHFNRALDKPGSIAVKRLMRMAKVLNVSIDVIAKMIR